MVVSSCLSPIGTRSEGKKGTVFPPRQRRAQSGALALIMRWISKNALSPVRRRFRLSLADRLVVGWRFAETNRAMLQM
jgi:hypothetical protein